MIYEAKNINSKLSTTPVEPEKTNVRGAVTLRRRLLTSVLPAVLIPLVIASTVGYYVTERGSRTEAIERLKANSLLTSDTVEIFIKDSFDTLNLVAANPDLTAAMRSASQDAETQNLSQLPIEALEKRFADTKLLKPNADLNNYLKQVVNSTDIIEIFYTDRNGLNLAYSNATSDFVQRDEGWWQDSKANGRVFGEPEFDESANSTVFPLSVAIKDPQTQEFLGVINAVIPVTALESNLDAFLSIEARESEVTQIIDIDAEENAVVSTINTQGSQTEVKDIIGGATILQVGQILLDALEKEQNIGQIIKTIGQQSELSNIEVEQEEISGETFTDVQLKYQDKFYSISTIPGTHLVTVETIDAAQVAAASRSLLTVFAVTALALGAVSLAIILLLARQLSSPLTDLSGKTEEVAAGNLDVTATETGTLETRTLASNFNLLVGRVKNLLQEQTEIAEQQRLEKEQLELAIYTLLDEVGDATDGDLTVRANLDSMELSTVADLFNAIIGNLQDIAIEAKQSSNQVGSFLKENEVEIRLLAEQANSEAQETRTTLVSIEQMSQSIQTVAANATEVEKIADNTYNTVVDSTKNMGLTADSILELRNTVDETGIKMKLLGQSSQKISQAVKLIEEIALKTNVLAVNARVEARRAGEYGQGFTIVAEQVGALAEQSVQATKEIAGIVAAIQAETNEVSQAMESGTIQALESTRLVEVSRQNLAAVLTRSQEMNQLVSSISQATVSQASTSQDVTNLMQKIAQLSETTSQSSTKVAQSIVETAQVAQKLESTVAQFKVAEAT